MTNDHTHYIYIYMYHITHIHIHIYEVMQGLVVFSACSHAGIVNVMESATKHLEQKWDIIIAIVIIIIINIIIIFFIVVFIAQARARCPFCLF